jgi:hypothetical protein
MFYPDMRVSAAVAVVVAVGLVVGIWRHRLIAPPKTIPAADTAESAAASDDLVRIRLG